ncbi:hypothetical protein IWQ62_001844 [Dispira parvispora]|uniref:TATA-binding protein interacting (TIP20) domain-containing protein n=1 Tax=Dispira parvispora TaxID=1520584 RepID=A0A9W8E3D2_9FUNG|nr:hypothetical protein IWQ62_001844 [Dispira parvispora]
MSTDVGVSIAKLLEKVALPDADYRYMAVNDLAQLLLRQPGYVPEPASSPAVLRALQLLLQDANSEVQNITIQHIALVSRLLNQKDLLNLVDFLRSGSGLRGLESLPIDRRDTFREVASLTLKTLLTDIPSTHDASGKLAYHLVPILAQQLQETMPQVQDTATSTSATQLVSVGVLTETVELIALLLSKFQAYLVTSFGHDDAGHALRSQLATSLWGLLTSHQRTSTRRFTIGAFTSLLLLLPTDECEKTLQMITSHLHQLVSVESSKNSWDTKCTFLQMLTTVTGRCPHLVVNWVSQWASLVIQLLNVYTPSLSPGDQTEGDWELDDFNAQHDEIREHCLTTLRAFCENSPQAFATHCSACVTLALRYLPYDPNYQDNVLDALDLISSDMDPHGAPSYSQDIASWNGAASGLDDNDYNNEISEDGMSDLDDDGYDDDDASWQVRRSSIHLLDAVLKVHPLSIIPDYPRVVQGLLRRFYDRELAVRTVVYQALLTMITVFDQECESEHQVLIKRYLATTFVNVSRLLLYGIMVHPKRFYGVNSEDLSGIIHLTFTLLERLLKTPAVDASLATHCLPYALQTGYRLLDHWRTEPSNLFSQWSVELSPPETKLLGASLDYLRQVLCVATTVNKPGISKEEALKVLRAYHRELNLLLTRCLYQSQITILSSALKLELAFITTLEALAIAPGPIDKGDLVEVADGNPALLLDTVYYHVLGIQPDETAVAANSTPGSTESLTINSKVAATLFDSLAAGLPFVVDHLMHRSVTLLYDLLQLVSRQPGTVTDQVRLALLRMWAKALATLALYPTSADNGVQREVTPLLGQFVQQLLGYLLDHVLNSHDRAIQAVGLDCLETLVRHHHQALTIPQANTRCVNRLVELFGHTDPLVTTKVLTSLAAALEYIAENPETSTQARQQWDIVIQQLSTHTIQGLVLVPDDNREGDRDMTALCHLYTVVVRRCPTAYDTLAQVLLAQSSSKRNTSQVVRSLASVIVTGLMLPNLAPKAEATLSLLTTMVQTGSGSTLEAQLFALDTLGFVGQQCDLTKSNTSRLWVAVEETLQHGSPPTLQTTAGRTLGKLAYGSADPSLLDTILTDIVNDTLAPYRLHYLEALQEFLRLTPQDQSPKVEPLWNRLTQLVSQGEQDENTLTAISNCLGYLTLLAPGRCLSDLCKNCSATSSDLRLVSMKSLRHLGQLSSDTLAPLVADLVGYLPDMLQLIDDPVLKVRHTALLTLDTLLRNHAYLFPADRLVNVLPLLYQATRIREDLVRTVQLGPFQHRIDEGLDARKCAYDNLYNLVGDTSWAPCLTGEFFACLERGLADIPEIQNQVLLLLIRLTRSPLFVTELVAHLDSLTPPLETLVNQQSRPNATNQEMERVQDLVRLTVRTIAALSSLCESQNMTTSVPRFQGLVAQVQQSTQGKNFYTFQKELNSQPHIRSVVSTRV